MKLKISLFLICAIALASCVDIPDFDNTPKIYYNSVDHYPGKDSLGNPIENVIISLDFEDGDGDLGASDAERSDTVKYSEWGNYELITCTYENKVWVERILAIDKRKFFPDLKSDGKSGPIKGRLDLNTAAPYFPGASLILYKWKIRIRDRALRVSNQVETDTVRLPRFD